MMSSYIDNEFWENIIKVVERSLEKNFIKYLPYLENYVDAIKTNDNSDLLNRAKTSIELKITPQTLTNWFKNNKTKFLLKNTKVKRGEMFYTT